MRVLKQELREGARRHLNTRSDSEILLNVFAHELSQQDIGRLEPEHVFAAVKGLYRRCEGAYATVVIIPGVGLVAFRGEHGIRPLCYGFRETDKGTEFMVASESVSWSSS